MADVKNSTDVQNVRRHQNDAETTSSFAYFAYGSNLLERRIHINNPSAVRVGIGRLDDYRLDFITYSTRWRGASATIVPHKGVHVWGAVWLLDREHMATLDEQEGVAQQIYFPMDVDIVMADGTRRECRVYRQHAAPLTCDELRELPKERRPSEVYLRTIVVGAEECGLPEYYRRLLGAIAHNGYSGEVDVNLSE